MKIAYGSDFHFEFYMDIEARQLIKQWKFEEDTDIIIIAGDLHVGARNVVDYLDYIYTVHGIHILYVPGNHEYYGSSFKEENSEFHRLGIETERYHILLNCGSFYMGNVAFAGCMGNIDGSWEEINIIKHGALNDFHQIADFYDRVRLGKLEHNNLDYNISRYDCPVVAITHTMPSPKMIHPKYEGSYLNPCFANDWEDIMFNHPQLKYWICGHSHDSNQGLLQDTHIMLNPRGYPQENRKGKPWEWRYIDV